MTADLVAFLTARLDETEADARDAAGTDALGTPSSGVWTYVETPGGDHKVIDDTGHTVSGHYEVGSHPWDTGPHIARHDPARVLRDVAARRRIVENYVKVCGYGLGGYTPRDEAYVLAEGALATTVKILAAVHEDHPDYQEAWRP